MELLVMADDIHFTIDGQPITVPSGTTILDAAKQANIAIPTICFHEHCTANALCRLCVVEIEGSRLLQPSCTAPASPGMIVHTRSERVKRSRRTILEMLNASVDLSDSPEVNEAMAEYHVDPNRFPESLSREVPSIDDNPMYIRDYAKCVLCWRCVQVCADDAQYTYAINFSGRGFQTSIATFFEKPLLETTCVFCGQCVGVCPTGALKPKRQWLLEQGLTPRQIIDTMRQSKRASRKKKVGSDQ
jgi:NADH dehydrogenase/NADH:ubiquinone oxidoreductase subunit G